MCYSKQIAIWVSSRVPSLNTWFICQTILDYLSLIVNVCVLNQFAGLLFNALNFLIITSFKAKEEVNAKPYFKSLMDDDSRISFKLASLPSSLDQRCLGFWIPSFHPWKHMMKRKHITCWLWSKVQELSFCFFICW